MKFEWEVIFSKQTSSLCMVTSRVKVIGGWLILNKYDGALPNPSTGSVSLSQIQSMVFVHDPEHKWEIEND